MHVTEITGSTNYTPVSDATFAALFEPYFNIKLFSSRVRAGFWNFWNNNKEEVRLFSEYSANKSQLPFRPSFVLPAEVGEGAVQFASSSGLWAQFNPTNPGFQRALLPLAV